MLDRKKTGQQMSRQNIGRRKLRGSTLRSSREEIGHARTIPIFDPTNKPSPIPAWMYFGKARQDSEMIQGVDFAHPRYLNSKTAKRRQ
jgi:hypothetical protein